MRIVLTIILFLSIVVGSVDSVAEPATKVKFPKEVTVPGCTKSLVLLGTGTELFLWLARNVEVPELEIKVWFGSGRVGFGSGHFKGSDHLALVLFHDLLHSYQILVISFSQFTC